MDNNRRTESQPQVAISIGDIYYVLFRHKWKIIILSLAGILAAAGLYHFKPPPYVSLAELQIQYVKNAGIFTVGPDQRVVMPDTKGDDIVNSEIKILTSLDLADEVATNFGAARILAKVGGGNNPIAAAGYLAGHLDAEPTDKGSSVIVVTFSHPDPKLVQPILREIITNYYKNTMRFIRRRCNLMKPWFGNRPT